MMTARMADFLATRGEAHDLVSAEATEQVRNQRFIESTVVYTTSKRVCVDCAGVA